MGRGWYVCNHFLFFPIQGTPSKIHSFSSINRLISTKKEYRNVSYLRFVTRLFCGITIIGGRKRFHSSDSEVVFRRCSVKEGVLKNFVKFTENTCAGVSVLIKLQAWDCFMMINFLELTILTGAVFYSIQYINLLK